MFDSFFEELFLIFSGFDLSRIVRLVLVIVIGLLFINLFSFALRRIIRGRLSPQAQLLIYRLVRYLGFGILLMYFLNGLGISLAPILGTAGVVGVALGIASQTSLSSVVAGLFLMSENSFSVGDVLKIDTTVGIVQSIDLLSVKIKTFDNRAIRYPNQKLINQEFTNITRYPIRRIDQKLWLTLDTDLIQVQQVLKEVATQEPLILSEPAPLIVFANLSSYYIEIVFGVWITKDNYLAVRNSLTAALLRSLQEAHLKLAKPIQVIELEKSVAEDMLEEGQQPNNTGPSASS